MGVIPIHRQGGAHPQAGVCGACSVRGQALFGALDEDALQRIHTHIAEVALAPDEHVFRRGSAAAALYTIRSGLVRFEHISERGDCRVVRLAGPGDLFGQEALLRRTHLDDAVACTPVQLCRIPAGLVEEMGLASGELQKELMRRWQQALEDAEAWLADLASGSARQRMLALLQRLAQHAQGQGEIWLPRREQMGAMLDMTLETASRQVSQLRREGVLESDSARITRVDLPRLQAALHAEGMLSRLQGSPARALKGG